MRFIVNKCSVEGGAIDIPGSKSHTIRALFFATLANGVSVIEKPLASADTASAMYVCKALGARIEEHGDRWEVAGTGGDIQCPEDVLDVGNSGTTMRLALGVAALCGGGSITLTGDEQIRKRPVANLVNALNDLGAEVCCERENGCPPVTVSKPLSGGSTTLAVPTSQYLTSLLICAPLAPAPVEITVTQLNEIPYVEMTLWWLDKLGVKYERRGFDWFRIEGGQHYRPLKQRIPADFSSATFFAVAAAVSGMRITLRGLDMTDVQGDKAVLDYLAAMGTRVETVQGGVRVEGGPLRGGTFDLNATPDALPAMAVAACFADGETRLVNVPQARMKETDRIAVMTAELRKMGARVEELPDGMIIRKSDLRGAVVDGHSDHRVVMSLAVAGTEAEGRTIIDTAESAAVTFPGFFDLMKTIGADISKADF